MVGLRIVLRHYELFDWNNAKIQVYCTRRVKVRLLARCMYKILLELSLFNLPPVAIKMPKQTIRKKRKGNDGVGSSGTSFGRRKFILRDTANYYLETVMHRGFIKEWEIKELVVV